MPSAEEAATFWVDECEPAQWYAKDDALDAEIARRFGGAVAEAMDGAFPDWARNARAALGYLILLDQFTRNIYRDDPRAFAGDARAREIARLAIPQDLDLQVAEPGRQFFYMPLVHSEDPSDIDAAIALMEARLPERGAANVLHARAHREVIRRYGRYPYRNAALGRVSTEAETAFLDGPGYQAILDELQEV